MRKLTDRELQAVLDRAAAIDATTVVAEWGPADLEGIAAEAGISSEALRRAVAEFSRTRRPRFAIPRIEIRRHRAQSSNDVSVSDADLALLLRLLQGLGKGRGRVESYEGQIEWMSPDGVQVTVTRLGSRTEVVAEGDVSKSLGLTGLLLLGTGVAAASAVSGVVDLGPAVAVGAAYASSAVAYWRYRLVRVRERTNGVARSISELLQRLAERSVDAQVPLGRV